MRKEPGPGGEGGREGRREDVLTESVESKTEDSQPVS